MCALKIPTKPRWAWIGPKLSFSCLAKIVSCVKSNQNATTMQLAQVRKKKKELELPNEADCDQQATSERDNNNNNITLRNLLQIRSNNKDVYARACVCVCVWPFNLIGFIRSQIDVSFYVQIRLRLDLRCKKQLGSWARIKSKFCVTGVAVVAARKRYIYGHYLFNCTWHDGSCNHLREPADLWWH